MNKITLATVCFQHPHTFFSGILTTSVRLFSLNGIEISGRRCLYGCVGVFSTRAVSTSGFCHILNVHPFSSLLWNPWLMLRNLIFHWESFFRVCPRKPNKKCPSKRCMHYGGYCTQVTVRQHRSYTATTVCENLNQGKPWLLKSPRNLIPTWLSIRLEDAGI